MWRAGESDPAAAGLEQLDQYLDRLGLDHGTLVVFDRRPRAEAPSVRTEYFEQTTPSGRKVTLLRA